MKFEYLILCCLFAYRSYAWTFPWNTESTTSTSTTSDTTSSATSIQTKASNTNQYAPVLVSCDSDSMLREADGISEKEKSYMAARRKKTNTKLRSFLENATDISNLSKIIDNDHNISIGLAFSGGGYRAMLCGAGELLALDDRFDESINSGLGGILQSASYITGLSGGSWLVGSLVLNDWISIADIIEGNIDIWDLEDTIFNPNGINILKTVGYYNQINDALDAKVQAGFDTSITDLWGRALAHQFFESENGGLNITWSSIRNMSNFKSHEMPYPIVVSDGRTPNTIIIDENSTVFEMSPFEIGSWDPSLRSFFDIEHLGTLVDQGVNGSGKCIKNYDNAGFILGTSSSLFNEAIIRLKYTDMNGALKYVLNKILSSISSDNNDIAVYEPNPFYNGDYGSSDTIVNNETLFLVDGGEDQQNVPLNPLIQPARDMDVIFAFDNSADTTNNWPNGSSLVNTYERQFSDQGYGAPFPHVPPVEEFVKQGLNERPVFFGCDAQNLTDLTDHHGGEINVTDIPLIIYIPNAMMSEDSNTSTYKMSYSNDEKMNLITNGFEVSSQMNLTDDKSWATCVGCAIIRRSQERNGLDQPPECQKCFQDYCWGNASLAAADKQSSKSSATSKTTSTSKAKSTSKDTSTSKATSTAETTSFKKSSSNFGDVLKHASPITIFLFSFLLSIL